MERNFTKEDTNALKGFAIICMVFHHVYPNITYIPVNRIENVTVLSVIAAMGKICVALLTLLSGYGLAESYSKQSPTSVLSNVKFILSHYIKLVSLCWFAHTWSLVIQYMLGNNVLITYGNGVKCILNYFIDVLGFSGLVNTPSLVGGWYYTAIVMYYLLYPLVHYLIYKIGLVFLVLLAMPWVPWTLKYIPEVESITRNYNSDQWIYYLFAFALGIYLSKKEILNQKLSGVNNPFKVMKSAGLLVICVFLRAYITIPIDLILSYAIVNFYVMCLADIKWLKSFFGTFGKTSANMWLVHGTIIAMTSMWTFKSHVYHFVIVFFFSYAVSLALDVVKKGLRYNSIVDKIRMFVTKETVQQ